MPEPPLNNHGLALNTLPPSSSHKSNPPRSPPLDPPQASSTSSTPTSSGTTLYEQPLSEVSSVVVDMASAAAATSNAAASFWTQKLQTVKTSGLPKGSSTNGTNPSTMAVKKDPIPAQAVPAKPQTNGMIFKRKTLPHVWGDEDSDDDELEVEWPASFTHGNTQDPTTQLNAEVDAKDECIKELETQIESKELRVQELEGKITKCEDHIKELTAISDEKDRRAAQLEADLEKKVAHIQGLEDKIVHLEVTIAEAKVEEHPINTAEVAEPVFEASAPETVVSQPPTPEKAISPKVTPPITPSLTLASLHRGSMPPSPRASSTSPPKESTTTEVASSETRLAHTASEEPITEGLQAVSPTQAKTLLACSPAPRDDSGPIFVTPETVKQVPLPPPAPKLSFPTQKPKKTPVPAPTLPKLATLAPATPINGGAWPSTGWLPDIRNLSREQREGLGRGPNVTITLSGTKFSGIPKCMLMQVSEYANDFFTKNPRAEVMPFPEGGAAVGAVREIATWIKDVSKSPKEFSMKIRFTQHTPHADTINLAIMAAARSLGMTTYIRHFTRYYCDEIRTHVLPLDTIALIEKYAIPNDPVYDCLVNNLAHHRSKQNLPDQDALDAFIAGHPRLAAAMEKANVAIQRKREAGKKGSVQSRASSVASWE